MSVIIVIYHYNFFILEWKSDVYFRGGYVSVDAFFVISGFFCAALLSSMPPGSSFLSWLKRRLRSLYPYYVTALLFAVISSLIMNGLCDMKGILAMMEELLMIHEWGIVSFQYYNGATWYISAMLFVSCAYFFISEKFSRENQLRVIATAALLCLSVILLKFGHIHVHGVVKRHISLGVMRAFAGMGIGWLLFTLKDKFRLAHSGLMFLLSVVMILVVALLAKDSCFDVVIYPASVLAVVSSSALTVGHENLRGILSFSGRMSYALYLSHGTVLNILSRFAPEYSLLLFMSVSFIAALILMGLAWKLSELVKP